MLETAKKRAISQQEKMQAFEQKIVCLAQKFQESTAADRQHIASLVHNSQKCIKLRMRLA